MAYFIKSFFLFSVRRNLCFARNLFRFITRLVSAKMSMTVMQESFYKPYAYVENTGEKLMGNICACDRKSLHILAHDLLIREEMICYQ